MEPLTIFHVRLAPWHLTRLMSIHQLDVKSTLFEHFKQRDPVDPGRLHHHGVNLTLPQPLGQGVEVGGKRPKPLHRLHIPICAIGGVTPANARPLVEAGAGMVAAVEGVFGARDVAAAARAYARLFDN